jgi:anti-anti-sigma regulatory factor
MFEFEIQLDCENNETFTKKFSQEKKKIVIDLTKINRINNQ